MIKKFSLKKEHLETKEKNEFVNRVEKTIKTPIAPIKYCYLAKPFFYPGSYVPRYSVTLLFDKNNEDQKKFLENLEEMATKNNVDSLGYLTEEGLISIKFQGKDTVKTYTVDFGKKTPKEVELEHDLPEGFQASVVFELNTYFNKKTQKNGFNFCPKKVIFHLDEDTQEASEPQESNEVEVVGNSKNSRNRSRAKVNRVRSDELQPGNKRGVGKQLRARKNPPKV